MISNLEHGCFNDDRSWGNVVTMILISQDEMSSEAGVVCDGAGHRIVFRTCTSYALICSFKTV